jgi:hypothetical protein
VFFAASLLLSYDESIPVAKHRVGLLEERVIFGASNSRGVGVGSNNLIWMLTIHTYISPWTKYKLQYFTLHFSTVSSCKGSSFTLSWPLLELSLPYRAVKFLQSTYSSAALFQTDSITAIEPPLRSAIVVYSCFSSSLALLAADIHTRALYPPPIYTSASNIRRSVLLSENHLWRTELQRNGSATNAMRGLTHAPSLQLVLKYSPTTGRVGTRCARSARKITISQTQWALLRRAAFGLEQ